MTPAAGRGVAVLAAAAVLLLAACTRDDAQRPAPALDGQTPTAPPGADDTEPGTPLPDDAWTRFAEAPAALSEVGAAAFGGQVWTAGGLAGDGGAVATVQVFDPVFATWQAGPDLPEPVHHAALVSTGAEVYLLGGYVGGGFDAPTAAVRRLDPATGEWTDGPPLPAPRAAGAAAWDGQRVVYGGGVGPDGLSGDVVALERDEWTRIGELSRPREHLAAAGDEQGRVWFLAGRTGGLDTNLATVDLAQAGDVTALGQVPTARGGVAAFWSPTTGACVVGGEAPAGTFAEVECIDAEGAVTVLPPLSSARHGLGAAVVGGIAYTVLGGTEPGLSVSAAVEGLRVDAVGG